MNTAVQNLIRYIVQWNDITGSFPAKWNHSTNNIEEIPEGFKHRWKWTLAKGLEFLYFIYLIIITIFVLRGPKEQLSDIGEVLYKLIELAMRLSVEINYSRNVKDAIYFPNCVMKSLTSFEDKYKIAYQNQRKSPSKRVCVTQSVSSSLELSDKILFHTAISFGTYPLMGLGHNLMFPEKPLYISYLLYKNSTRVFNWLYIPIAIVNFWLSCVIWSGALFITFASIPHVISFIKILNEITGKSTKLYNTKSSLRRPMNLCITVRQIQITFTILHSIFRGNFLILGFLVMYYFVASLTTWFGVWFNFNPVTSRSIKFAMNSSVQNLVRFAVQWANTTGSFPVKWNSITKLIEEVPKEFQYRWKWNLSQWLEYSYFVYLVIITITIFHGPQEELKDIGEILFKLIEVSMRLCVRINFSHRIDDFIYFPNCVVRSLQDFEGRYKLTMSQMPKHHSKISTRPVDAVPTPLTSRKLQFSDRILFNVASSFVMYPFLGLGHNLMFPEKPLYISHLVFQVNNTIFKWTFIPIAILNFWLSSVIWSGALYVTFCSLPHVIAVVRILDELRWKPHHNLYTTKRSLRQPTGLCTTIRQVQIMFTILFSIFRGNFLAMKFLDDDLQNDEKCKNDQVQGSLITIKPSILRFPYNDPNGLKQRVAIWNRTNTALKVSVKSQDPSLFAVKLEGATGTQLLIHGLAASTFSVKCIPGHYKILRKYLDIFVYTSRDKCECLRIPVEIYPSASWFKLPRTISMPLVVLGQRANAVITLPEPQNSERFFVTFHPSDSRDMIKLTPTHGVLGGKNGITQLVVSYTPMEYTTVSCSIKIHFPGLSTEPYEILILARCKPGVEAAGIREEIAEIETFRPKPQRSKKKCPKMKFKTLMEPDIIDQTKAQLEAEFKRGLDLFTTAGVTRFLLQKNEPLKSRSLEEQEERHKRKTALELLTVHVDLDPREKMEIYSSIKKRLGFEFEAPSGPSYAAKIGQPKIKTKQRKAWDEFQKTVGVALLGKIQSMPVFPVVDDKRPSSSYATPPRYSLIKKSPPSRESSGKKKSSASSDILEEIKKIRKSMVQRDFTARQKFIQLALIVITRMRVDKRLVKIKALVEKLKKKREAELENMSNKSGSVSGKRHSKRRVSAKKSVQVLYEKEGSRESQPLVSRQKSKHRYNVNSRMDVQHGDPEADQQGSQHAQAVLDEDDKVPKTKSKVMKPDRKTVTTQDWQA
ncbi:unnamed protein product [Orchesella dallaii]|uniref:Uncharacterized protein n=1 Tax=Orchesella dallaii TaxID=48710 RepID=A0ABP1Q480_9HEXA